MNEDKNSVVKSSTPSYFDFDPTVIPFQYKVIYDIKKKYDYSLGVHYVLLSGSVGSAKSVLMAWIILNHCTENDGARVCLGRKALPDLKDTIFKKILEMLENSLTEGKDYWVRRETAYIKFKNGSEIISRTWHDKNFQKFRSLELSMLAIEELTESDARYWDFFEEAIARVERLPHIKENLVIAATNPDDPSHPAYEFFIKGSKKKGIYACKDNNIHTYYSLTEQNPFLPRSYIQGLRKRFDAKMIKRMLEGQWLYIKTDVIYHQYDPEIHLANGLKVKKKLPLRITMDFNIAIGKPMSSALFQFKKDALNNSIHDRRYTFLDEVAIEGARTEDALESWQAKGWFDLPHNPTIIIHGDATGRHNDTRSKLSDYEIIEKYLANYRRADGDKLEYYIEVPKRNPPLRERHNIANGQLKNSEGVVGVVIDDKCDIIDAGFSNTRLKEGVGYLEDQTTKGQDISTACTYGIWYCEEYEAVDEDYIEFY